MRAETRHVCLMFDKLGLSLGNHLAVEDQLVSAVFFFLFYFVGQLLCTRQSLDIFFGEGWDNLLYFAKSSADNSALRLSL